MQVHILTQISVLTSSLAGHQSDSVTLWTADGATGVMADSFL